MKEIRKLSELKGWDKNPRTVTKEGLDRLKKQITKLGQYKPLLITKDNIVLGGNMRLKAYQDMGVDKVWVSVVDAPTEEKKIEYALSDNDRVGKYEGDQLSDLIGNFPEVEWNDYAVDIKEPQLVSDIMDRYSEVVEDEEEPIKDIKNIKILNLYSSIGGNRKLWGNLDITAVEINPEIITIYKDYFPNDKVIQTDAHKYLEEHFEEYDFIWASPPCPTHSRLRKGLSMAVGAKAVYPDMKLWQEILFLQGYFKGKWCVENVISWYDPLIIPQERGRHYYWSNFDIPNSDIFNITDIGNPGTEEYGEKSKKYGFNLDKYTISSKYPKEKILRDIVDPKAGKYILESAYENYITSKKQV